MGHAVWNYVLYETDNEGNGWPLGGSTTIAEAESFLSGVDCEDENYKLFNDKDVIIEGWRAVSRDLVAPPEIDGHPVVAIANPFHSIWNGSYWSNDSFGWDDIESLCLPEGLKVIGCRAFIHCNSLTSVNLPNGLRLIGEGAFNDCSSLVSVSLPVGLEAIGLTIKEDSFSCCGSFSFLSA